MKYLYFLLILALSLNLSAQSGYSNYISKHEYDSKVHNPEDYQLKSEKNHSIIPLKANNGIPSSTVFGYLPYWEYPDALDYLQYDILSHIAVFDFNVNPNGTLNMPVNWPWSDLINASHENGVKVILTAVNFSGTEIHDILNNETIRSTFFYEVSEIIVQYNLQGVNIDFENVPQIDRDVVLIGFMTELSEYLHNINPEYEVSFATPPVNWGDWDFYGLANSCDYLFIMGYNFYGPWSSTSGPCAPLTGGSYNITTVITNEYQDVIQCCPEKLILGLPYYGNKWMTTTNTAYSSVIDHISQPTYETAMDRLEQDTIIWDNISKTPWGWYAYSDYYQIWFDNDSSLGLKYELSKENSLSGSGMWALGYDGDRNELWNELWKHYGQPVSTESYMDNNQIWGFPNPCSNYFVLQSNCKISFQNMKIINTNGNLVYHQNNFLINNKLVFDISILPPGLYFMILIHKNINYNKTIKIVVQ